MPIASGTTLGVYEIATARGAGGMGEVYRARDTKLGRSVAIKVLPEAFVFDADRVETKPTLVFGKAVRGPRTFPTAAPTTPRTFDIAPNGKVIGVIVPGQTPTSGTQQRTIPVVLNWFEELKSRQ